jgi:hypothetical protein
VQRWSEAAYPAADRDNLKQDRNSWKAIRALTPGIHLDGLRRIHQQYIVWCYVEGRLPAIFDNMGPLGTVYHKLEWIQRQKWSSRKGRDLEEIPWDMRVLAWTVNDMGGVIEHMGGKSSTMRFKNAGRKR